MNLEKLAKLQAGSSRIGGKGTPRRKVKVVHKTVGTDDKKITGQLKKLGLNPIPGVEEVNMIKSDGTVIHFNNPKVSAAIGSNTFSISGASETKKIKDMLPEILSQLGQENMGLLQGLQAEGGAAGGDGGDDDVPVLEDNFDTAAKS